MKRNIAFLRAINVGDRRIKMDRLQGLFVEMGFAGVHTYLASGNVVFDAAADPSELEEQIAESLLTELGYPVPAFVRTIPELANIAAPEPFAEEGESPNAKIYVAFLKDELNKAQLGALESLENEVDKFECRGRELFWLRHIDAGESIPTGVVEKTLGVDATRRTISTVERVLRKFR